MAPRIPFNKPFVSGHELHYIAQAVTGGKIAADGQFTKRCAVAGGWIWYRQGAAHSVVHRGARDRGDALQSSAR